MDNKRKYEKLSTSDKLELSKNYHEWIKNNPTPSRKEVVVWARNNINLEKSDDAKEKLLKRVISFASKPPELRNKRKITDSRQLAVQKWFQHCRDDGLTSLESKEHKLFSDWVTSNNITTKHVAKKVFNDYYRPLAKSVAVGTDETPTPRLIPQDLKDAILTLRKHKLSTTDIEMIMMGADLVSLSLPNPPRLPSAQLSQDGSMADGEMMSTHDADASRSSLVEVDFLRAPSQTVSMPQRGVLISTHDVEASQGHSDSGIPSTQRSLNDELRFPSLENTEALSQESTVTATQGQNDHSDGVNLNNSSNFETQDGDVTSIELSPEMVIPSPENLRVLKKHFVGIYSKGIPPIDVASIFTTLLRNKFTICKSGGDGACFIRSILAALSLPVKVKDIVAFKERVLAEVTELCMDNNVIDSYNLENQEGFGAPVGKRIEKWEDFRNIILLKDTYFPMTLYPYLERLIQATVLVIDLSLKVKDQKITLLNATDHEFYSPETVNEDRHFILLMYTSSNEIGHFDAVCKSKSSSRFRFQDLPDEVRNIFTDSAYSTKGVISMMLVN